MEVKSLKEIMTDIEDRTNNEVPVKGIEVNAFGIFENYERYQKCEVCGDYTIHTLIIRVNGVGKSLPCCQFPCVAKYERKRRVEERARVLWD